MHSNINNKEKIFLINNFIQNTKNFWTEDKKYLDTKHLKIINKFEKKYKDNLNLYSKELINWEEQTNLGSPLQITYRNLKHVGFIEFSKKILSNLKHPKLTRYFNYHSFMDDIEIIKKNNGFKLLKAFPIHKKTDFKDLYFINKNLSSNNRWNRYVYIASQIKKNKLLNKNHCNWLDIGSFYGGLQMILKTFNKNSNFFLLDFNHQLCRSYVYLKYLYPKANHILPNKINKNLNLKKNSFYYVPVKKFNCLSKINFDLVTNFFSFGEMKKKSFEEYFNNKIVKNSKAIYLVNRFISSPNFDPTYDDKINVSDYERKNFKTIYFDTFPIHHYKCVKRKLFGRLAYRPISSGYFEKIMVKK